MTEYRVKNGIIVSQGKFEGEPEWVPTAWDLVMTGFADEEIGDSSILEMRTVGPDGDELAEAMGPAYKVGEYVALWEDGSGFINHVFLTPAQLEQARNEAFDNDLKSEGEER